jgi:uncharacterized protein (TIGR02996 family)
VTETELRAAIAAAPDDDAPRRVYADWLVERGDPRGEFIQLGLEVRGLADGERAAAVRRRAELAVAHRREWAPVECARFARGFAEELWVTLGGQPMTGEGPLLLPRIVHTSGPSSGTLEGLLTSPAAATIEELHLTIYASPDTMIAVLLEYPPPRLRGLSLRGRLDGYLLEHVARARFAGFLKWIVVEVGASVPPALAAIRSGPAIERGSSIHGVSFEGDRPEDDEILTSLLPRPVDGPGNPMPPFRLPRRPPP